MMRYQYFFNWLSKYRHFVLDFSLLKDKKNEASSLGCAKDIEKPFWRVESYRKHILSNDSLNDVFRKTIGDGLRKVI